MKRNATQWTARMIAACAVFLMCGALVAESHAADKQYCNGTVSGLRVRADGLVLVRGSWHNSFTGICNLKETRKGVAPSVCYGWYSLLHSATKEPSREVTVSYKASEYTCSSLPSYSSTPAPLYITLR